MALTMKLAGMLAPNKLIGRTVWSSPQWGEDNSEEKANCARCKCFVPSYPGTEYDPSNQKTYDRLTSGRCGQLRVLAAYGEKTPNCKTYYYCNFFERKEKEDGQ